ncbi:MAG: hypothetical protein R3F34_18700 [Planctomycetota bacterium]
MLTELGRSGEAVATWDTLIAYHLTPRSDWFLARAALQEPKAALAGVEVGIARFGNAVALRRRRGRPRGTVGQCRRRARRRPIAASPRDETWLARQGDVLARAGRADEARERHLAARTALWSLPRRQRLAPAMLEPRGTPRPGARRPTREASRDDDT